MTLVISLGTPAFVLQVGDRLVSTQIAPGGQREVMDPLANKQILYLANDAVVTVGYSGAAFLGDLPTDHVIAETLADATHRWDRGHLGIRSHLRPPSTLDEALERIRDRLTHEMRRENQRVPMSSLWVDIAGWRAGDAEPFMACYEYTAGQTSLETRSTGHLLGTVPPLRQTSAITRRLERRFQTLHEKEIDGRSAQQWLSGQIRRAARDNPTSIGRHLMSILISKPTVEGTLAPVRIEYMPDGSPALVQIVSQRTTQVVPGSFMPWIVTPGMIVPPQVLIGTGRVEISGLPMDLVGPAPPSSGLVWATSSQARPQRPT